MYFQIGRHSVKYVIYIYFRGRYNAYMWNSLAEDHNELLESEKIININSNQIPLIFWIRFFLGSLLSSYWALMNINIH
jgi:hypothetical protein